MPKAKAAAKARATVRANRVGKPAKQEESRIKRAHKLMKQTFNVFFFKSFGSPSRFFHLVKAGPDTCDLAGLLEQWQDVEKDELQGNRKLTEG